MESTSKPRVILLMGGPAAGKSTTSAREYPTLPVVDCDKFKPMIPGYDPKNITEEVHAMSAVLCNRALFEALGAGQSFVFDSTGTNAEKMVQIIKMAHVAGFDCELVYVRASVQTALRRNALRARTVNESIVREKHAVVETSFEILKGYADHVRVIDNDEVKR